MAEQGLFTSFMREHLPLSNFLASLPEVRELVDEIRRLASLDELNEIDERWLRARVQEVRRPIPQIGAPGMGRIDEGGGDLRDIGEGRRVSTTRYYLRYFVDGDVEMLRHWPDAASPEPRTVDADLMARIGGYENINRADDQDMKEYWRLSSTWTLGMVSQAEPRWALYTYVDMTREEERSFAENGTLNEIRASRYDVMAAVVEAIAAQAADFYDETLPRQLASMVEGRTSLLADRAAIVRSLDLPDDWAAEPIEILETAAPSESSATPDSVGHSEVEVELLGRRLRLSAKSFKDVISTIRTWADAVEANPRGFGGLDEDALSDLLAATLNATMPHAGREVYSRSGRTDISIVADILSEGAGPAKVFICESKWARGSRSIISALEKQIFRYATAHTTAAVLLVLCDQKHFAAARKRVVGWAALAPGALEPGAGEIDEPWPVLTYRLEGACHQRVYRHGGSSESYNSLRALQVEQPRMSSSRRRSPLGDWTQGWGMTFPMVVARLRRASDQARSVGGLRRSATRAEVVAHERRSHFGSLHRASSTGPRCDPRPGCRDLRPPPTHPTIFRVTTTVRRSLTMRTSPREPSPHVYLGVRGGTRCRPRSARRAAPQ